MIEVKILCDSENIAHGQNDNNFHRLRTNSTLENASSGFVYRQIITQIIAFIQYS